MKSLLPPSRLLTPLQSLVLRRWRPKWVCSSCSLRYPFRRRLATQATATEKPYYVTTPIFYVNAAPHIGHMYTMVLADVMKRWQVLKGRDAVLCTGTDEHGLKIQQAAEKAGSDPQSFCDRGAVTFKDLAARVNISYDHFVRTTDQSHKDAVGYAWSVLEERGLIYRSKHEGWYSVSDEAFYPESAVHMILDPRTGRKLMASKETGNEVQWNSEINYHFRLSAFRDRLLNFYQENPTWITPAFRMKDVMTAVEEGLEDLSISRPYDRLQWAVRVPTDDSQSIYVWLDALLNYASKAGYPWPPGSPNMNFWPADVQIIGKDIVRFHCIYWPAFLMALDLPLPKRIMTHAHWRMNNVKMSKSIGNVVNPFWAMDRFSVEIMRFILIRHGGLEDDANYDNSFIVKRYKTDLQDRLGNLVARVMRSKAYSPESAVERYRGNMGMLLQDCNECTVVMPASVAKRDLRSVNWDLRLFLKTLQDLPKKVDRQFADMEPNKGVATIMDIIYTANALVQNYEPWKIHKQLKKEAESPGTLGPGTKELLERRFACILFLMAETLRIAGILLQPVMPEKSQELLDTLNVAVANRRFQDAKVCMDESYRPKQQGGEEAKVLFPQLINTE